LTQHAIIYTLSVGKDNSNGGTEFLLSCSLLPEAEEDLLEACRILAASVMPLKVGGKALTGQPVSLLDTFGLLL
jgi:hypothetical protein